MNWFFLTLGYSGMSPKAPGTVGSVVALLLGLLILAFLDSTTLFLGALLATVAGYKMVNSYEAKGGLHDNKHIVIDELAGMWISLSIAISPLTQIPLEAYAQWQTQWTLWLAVLLSFVFFRYFDIFKPSVIGRIDREVSGGIGVMGDDVVAGVAAGILSALVMKLLFLYLGAA
ncbi:MAG: phosphatidylglycerophosphatase A [Campylobacterales bacterium]|nr:phosphatidylglycerophosphatase A [Campylobacterales bacterium]